MPQLPAVDAFERTARELATEHADQQSQEFMEFLIDSNGEDWHDAFMKASCMAASQHEDGAYQLMKAWERVLDQWTAYYMKHEHDVIAQKVRDEEEAGAPDPYDLVEA